MPQFELDLGARDGAELFKACDAFTQGYIEAMFFTDAGPDSDCADATVSELSAEAWAEIKRDCALFLAQLPVDGHGRSLLDLAYDYEPVEAWDYCETQAGRDFWLTRNRHGAGFWDRGLGRVGDDLTVLAHNFAEVSLYRGDNGQLYLS